MTHGTVVSGLSLPKKFPRVRIKLQPSEIYEIKSLTKNSRITVLDASRQRVTMQYLSE